MSVKPGLHNGRVEHHIHFWLGEEVSPDEAAIAAYKSVELDEHLGGSPIQHREVQGLESARFNGYFKKGLRYLSGGVKVTFYFPSEIFYFLLLIRVNIFHFRQV